jgi:hypothetical protein
MCRLVKVAIMQMYFPCSKILIIFLIQYNLVHKL